MPDSPFSYAENILRDAIPYSCSVVTKTSHWKMLHFASSWRSSKETRNGRDCIDETACVLDFIDEGLDAVSVVTDKLIWFDNVR
jgi:hypothetical protein